MLEYIYILQISECVNRHQSIYKIGKTKQTPKKRFDSYPKGTIVDFILRVNNCDNAEIELKKQFKNNFRQATEHGVEYFEGAKSKMIQLICEYEYNPSIFCPCTSCTISIMYSSRYFQFCCGFYHEHCIDKFVNENGLVCPTCKKEFKHEKVYYAGKIYKSVDGNKNKGGYPRLWAKSPCKKEKSSEDEISDDNTTGNDETEYKKKLKSFVCQSNQRRKNKIKSPVYSPYVELVGPKIPYCPREGCIECKFSHGVPVDISDDIVDDCVIRLHDADVIVALINKERDCYGTIMEIGMAISIGKPVYIVFENDDKNYKDMWFIVKNSLVSLDNGDQDYRNIRGYTLFNDLPTDPILNEEGLWTSWNSTLFRSEDEYSERLLCNIDQ